MSQNHSFVLKFDRRYSMAHRLNSGVAPNCQIPHGHDEVVSVEVAGSRDLDPDTNMLAEFSQVKGRWFDWVDRGVDHSFHLGESDPLIAYFQENEPHLLRKILVTPGDPTTEIRAACFAAKMSAFLSKDNPGLECQSLTIQETPTNAVEFLPPNGRVVEDGNHRWWNRADLSINDFEAPQPS
tara:strand:- start:18821 stop:19366 length:546 start_codon:yes stop_codon:yes gene_type:complete